MSEKEKNALDESLTGYKQKINHLSKASLIWDKELIFIGRTQEGYEIEFDAHVQWGCKPTDALLLSPAGCMGIDVVMFLQKMKMEWTWNNSRLISSENGTQHRRSTLKQQRQLFILQGKTWIPKKSPVPFPCRTKNTAPSAIH